MTFGLLRRRSFAALFWTQFLGAFNDNLYRNVLVLLTLYRLAGEAGPFIVTIAAGLFTLPYFLFSAAAGAVADRFDKAALARRLKLVEIAIMAAGSLALLAGNITALLAVLFLMGTQSAFFSPVKFGILPQLLAEEELMGGNALIEAATFLAILFGTILAGALVLTDLGVPLVVAGILSVAGFGWLTSLLIPARPAADAAARAQINILRATVALLRDLVAEPRLGPTTLAVSWFWFVGAVFLAQVPTYTKEIVLADESVVTFFLTLFSVGIGLGSLLAARLAGGRIDLKWVPLGALGMAAFGIDLFFATGALPRPAEGTQGLLAFLGQAAAWRVVVDLVGLAASGGLFVVPAFTAIQAWAPPDRRARIIAAVNVVNSGFVVASSAITLALQTAGLDVARIFLILSVSNLVAAALALRLAPELLPARIRRWADPPP